MSNKELSDTIAAAGDTEVESHDLADLVEADKQMSRKAAGRSRIGGLRFTKIVNPGTI